MAATSDGSNAVQITHIQSKASPKRIRGSVKSCLDAALVGVPLPVLFANRAVEEGLGHLDARVAQKHRNDHLDVLGVVVRAAVEERRVSQVRLAAVVGHFVSFMNASSMSWVSSKSRRYLILADKFLLKISE